MEDLPIPSAASIFSAFAVEHVSEARSKEGSDETASVELGNECFAEDDFIGAAMHYRKALEQGGESPEGLIRLAIALEASDEPEEAHELYKRAYEMQPSFEPAFAAAQTARTLALREEAEEWFRVALRIRPDSPFARFALAKFHREAGQRALAKKESRAAAELAETEPDYWLEAAELALDDSDPAAAEACCRKVLEFEPTHREAMLVLSASQWMQGKTGDAIASVRIAIELDDDSKIASGLLAKMLSLQGFHEDAKEEARRAEGLTPYDEAALVKILARLESAR